MSKMTRELSAVHSTWSSENGGEAREITAQEMTALENQQKVGPSKSFESATTSECTEDIVEIGVGGNIFRGTFTDGNHRRTPIAPVPEAAVEIEADKTFSSTSGDESSSWLETLEFICFLSCFSIFGSVLRVYMGRFFGYDCEEQGSVGDFLTPLSTRICVTNSGRTMQTGGAVFTDLPTNMLGSFVMGLLSPVDSQGHPLPWFRQDHHLQQHATFHKALTTGFCGCLTTFASWNTQMVVMLDGTDTDLGPQVAPALFGYIIGLACSVALFLFGRHVNGLWSAIHSDSLRNNLHSPASVLLLKDPEKPVEAAKAVRRCQTIASFHCVVQLVPFLLLAGLVAGFVVGDVVYQSQYYRTMWVVALLSPVGALLRWQLSRLNKWKCGWKRFEWVPWGTLAANLLASLVAVAADAVYARYVSQDANRFPRLSPILLAIEAGFSGNLSTVSTWVKEIVSMKRPQRMYQYSLGTIVLAMLLSLAVYAPIARTG